ncbi:YggT family protein [Cellulomonas hominis]
MSLVANLLYLVVLVFFLLLLTRLVIDWVQVFAREWKPTGVVLVLAEITYTVTDPPLRFLRRVIPPLSIGSIRLDLAFLVLMLISSFLLSLLAAV